MSEDKAFDINDARPNSVRHLIGQPGVVEQIVVALDSAQQDNRKFDHALLVGSPGGGKTAASQIIAAEMGTDFLDVLGQSINSVADLNALLLQATDRAVVFIDEAHELDKSLQTASTWPSTSAVCCSRAAERVPPPSPSRSRTSRCCSPAPTSSNCCNRCGTGCD